MPEPAAKPAPEAQTAPAEYSRTYSILFQAWLVLFLAVICFALLNYLYSYVPR
jgi:hypothetical protein